jgi:hypothetical protein
MNLQLLCLQQINYFHRSRVCKHMINSYKMPMTYKNKQYQEIAITLLNKSVKKIFSYSSASFTFQANRSHRICFSVTHLRWITGMGHASHLQQPLVGKVGPGLGRFVNKSSLLFETKNFLKIFLIIALGCCKNRFYKIWIS